MFKISTLALLGSISFFTSIQAMDSSDSIGVIKVTNLTEFLDTIKDPAIKKDDIKNLIEKLDPATIKAICDEVKEGTSFMQLATEKEIGIFKRNEVSKFCQTYIPPKEAFMPKPLDEDRLNIRGKSFTKEQNEVGKLQLSPTEATDKTLTEVGKLPPRFSEKEDHDLIRPMTSFPESDEGEKEKERPERKKIEIPSAFLKDAKATQEQQLEHTQNTLAAIKENLESIVDTSQVAIEEQEKKAALRLKLEEAEKQVKKAKEWYDNWTVAVMMLREDVAAAKASNDQALQAFKEFKETNHEDIPLNDEDYLAALVAFKNRIGDQRWVAQVEQAQTYFADAKRDLEEANRLMDAILQELNS